MNRISVIQIFLYLIVSLAFALPLEARMMFLSTTGEDSVSCRAGAVFRTLGRAAECLAPGDTLIVRPGIYDGGVWVTVKATAEAPVLIQGESLEAEVDSSTADMPDAIRIQDASYVTLDRITVRKAIRAGCGVRFSNHITITNSRFGDNGVWGIFTSFADDIRFEGNECFGSKKEHGIYHSNSGDRFVIRGNIVHHNSGNGLHMNGDPEMGGDGVLNWGVVEKNIIYNNGYSGGAGINMTHVHDILVRNNLVYKNYAGGITIYQDTGTFEQGSKRVLVMGNTVYFRPGEGRSGVNVQTTTEKVLIAGNIFVSGVANRGAIEVNSDHLSTIVSDRNVLWSVDTTKIIERKGRLTGIEAWRALSGNDLHSLVAEPKFASIDSADFTLDSASPAVAAGMTIDSVREILERLGGFEWILSRLDSLPGEDIRGRLRPTAAPPDAGAYEREVLYDFNGDGLFNLADAVALIILSLDNPDDPRLDVNRDGGYSIADVIRVLMILLRPA